MTCILLKLLHVDAIVLVLLKLINSCGRWFSDDDTECTSVQHSDSLTAIADGLVQLLRQLSIVALRVQHGRLALLSYFPDEIIEA